MKKTILSIATAFSFAFLASGQITINVVGEATDIAGTTYTINADQNDPELLATGFLSLDLEIHNNSGSEKTWRVTRRRLDVPSDWSDLLCFGSSCFPPSSLESYCSPASTPLVVSNGAEGGVLLHFTPPSSPSANLITYRYYVGDCNTFEDSVDIHVNFTLGTKELTKIPSLSIAPNPANEVLTIATSGVESATLKIVDVLGNLVFTDIISNTKKIDVSNFKNGIYFVTLQTNGATISNRKLIVRH
jgi:hypothetical protein